MILEKGEVGLNLNAFEKNAAKFVVVTNTKDLHKFSSISLFKDITQNRHIKTNMMSLILQ